MKQTMNYKGFVVIVGVILIAFFWLHNMMRNDLHRKDEMLKERQVVKSRLEEENLDLNNQLSIVDTKDYIVSSAIENYNYMSRDDIRFTFSNPEALYAYSEEEIQILMDELAD